MSSEPDKPVDIVDGVLTIRLLVAQNPTTTALNDSIDIKRLKKLLAVLESAQFDKSIHVIVLGVEQSVLENALEATTPVEKGLLLEFVQLLRQMPQPIVAMAHGPTKTTVKSILDVCDIVFADGDGDGDEVTLSFPSEELEAQTYQLAHELAAKDPLALRFTKRTLQQVSAVPWDGILDYTTAQQAEIKSLQAGQTSARAKAIESFLAGKSKPGAGA